MAEIGFKAPLAAGRLATKAKRVPGGLQGKVLEDLPIWLQFQRVGGQVSPTQLSEIIRQADTGYIFRLIDVANEAKQKDCHLSAVLSQSEESLAGLEWELVLPEGAMSRERKAMDWTEEHLRTKIAAPFGAMVAHQAGGVYYSLAVSETMWAKDDDKRVVPVDFDNQSARRFGFRISDGKLVWRDQMMGPEGVDFRALFPNKFVVSQPRVTGDVPAREGMMRVLVWAALFRSWGFTDWLRTGETAWKPWRIGHYDPEKVTEEDIDNLITVLDRLVSTGSAAISKSVDFKVEWPGGQGGTKATHSELVNVLAQEMSKAALGQTETVQASGTSGYAQAKVHQDVSGKILKGRARHLAAVITRDVIRPMIQLNFGSNFAIPTFRFLTDDSADLKAFSEGLKNLTGPQGAGLQVPAKWARGAAGIPEPEKDEELVGAPAEPEVPANDTTVTEPAKPAPKEPPAATEGEADNTPPVDEQAAE